MKQHTRVSVLIVILVMLLAINALAVAPTKDAIAQWQADGTWDQFVKNWQNFKARGGCSPDTNTPFDHGRIGARAALSTNAIDTIRVCVILLDFPDCKYNQATYPIPGGGTLTMHAAGTQQQFDSLLFSVNTVPTGSMTDFYYENAYQKVFIQGDVYGWFTMSHNYSYYVGSDNGMSMGSTLAGEALNAANPTVDFSQYDNDGDNTVEGVILIHAGPGAEVQGTYGIWSHKSGPSGVGLLDGMYMQSYTLNPEEYGNGLSTVGVFCHEYGHVLGLPDLYDINSGNSPDNDGLGDWSLMAGGSWNDNGRHPAHFDGWCRTQLGWSSITWISTNQKQAAIPSGFDNPVIIGLRNNTVSTTQYWLMENRRKQGFDAYLPAGGLLIYHIDNSVATNDNPNRLHVGLEQADGLFNLELTGGTDAGDPFPGSTNKRNFTDRTTPNSRLNAATTQTQVGVWNISNADSVMYADLDIRWSRPYVEFYGSDSVAFSDQVGGDNDGILEQGETARFNCRLQNTMLGVGYGHVHLSCDNAQLQILNNDVQTSAVMSSNGNVTLQTPIQILVPADFQSRRVRFTMQVAVDSLASPGGDTTFHYTFSFAKSFGVAQILLVDDDNGQIRSGFGYEKRITDGLDRLGFPYVTWNKLTQGTPPPATLFQYLSVIWFTGPSSQSGGNYGGTITVGDLASMRAHLDAGGSLLFSSNTAAQQISVLDPSFLTNYLHCTYTGLAPVDEFAQEWRGHATGPTSGGTKHQLGGSEPVYYQTALIDTVNGGMREYYGQAELAGPLYGTIGVSYSGAYRTLFLTFPLESTNDGLMGQGWAPKDTLLQRALNFYQGAPVLPSISYFHAAAETDVNHIVSNTPTFAWSYVHWLGITPQQVEFKVGTDNDWSVAEMWDPATIPTGDSSIAYAGTPLADGQTYYVRLRAHDDTNWTSWYEFSFRMNSAPSASSPQSPVAGATSTTGALTTDNATDPENDARFYQFEVYADSAGTSPLRSSGNTAEAPGTTVWTIAPTLTDDQVYWWRVRAYDGYEYSSWSTLQKFALNTSQSAPSAFTLTSPPDPSNLPVYDMKPTFTWAASTDSDLGDTVRYKLEIADNSGFASPTVVDSILAISHEVTDSLAFAMHYYWRVTAFDKSGLSAQASAKNFWTWQLGDIDHTHGTDIGDLTALIDNLFITFTPINPPLVADLTGDCQVDIADLTALIDNLFVSFTPLKIGCQ